MLESIYHFDWNVFQFVEQHCWNPVLDVIMKIITTLGEGGIIFFVFAGAFLLFGFIKKNDSYKKIALAMVISLAVMVVVNNLLIKNAIARTRPFNLDWSQYSWAGTFNFPEIVHRPSSYSFPSGHSSSAFAACFAIFFYNKKWGTPALVFAALMAFSRVYVHVHYCTDVLAGAVVGIIYALLGVLITKFIFNFVNEKIFGKVEQTVVNLRKNKE